MFLCAMKIGACVMALAVGFYLYKIAGSKCLQEILSAVDQSSQIKAEQYRYSVKWGMGNGKWELVEKV